ncbi:MAG: hypothetical protein QW429_05165 [Thermoprotei archaeon]
MDLRSVDLKVLKQTLQRAWSAWIFRDPSSRSLIDPSVLTALHPKYRLHNFDYTTPPNYMGSLQTPSKITEQHAWNPPQFQDGRQDLSRNLSTLTHNHWVKSTAPPQIGEQY